MIIFLLDHHNNVLNVFFYTRRSAQLNMNGRMHEVTVYKNTIQETEGTRFAKSHFIGNKL